MNRKILINKLSIGHNGNPDFIKIINKYHNYIHDIYFSTSGSTIPSTRPNTRVNNANYSEIISRDIKICKERGYNIKFSLLLNSQCWRGEYRSKKLLDKIVNSIEMIGENNIDDFVVSDEFLGKKLKEKYPKKTISISVINEINSVQECLELMEIFNDFDTICLGHRLTYNIEEIKRIKELTEKKIKLLCNQGCYYNCPDYMLHSIALAHTHNMQPIMENGKQLYCNHINSLNNENSWKNLTHQALNPIYIKNYCSIVDFFKLSTRIDDDINRIEDIIESYLFCNRGFEKKLFMGGSRGLSYKNAAIFSLVEYPENYFEIRTKCNNKCYQCNYCKELWSTAEKKFNEEPNISLKKLFIRENEGTYPV